MSVWQRMPGYPAARAVCGRWRSEVREASGSALRAGAEREGDARPNYTGRQAAFANDLEPYATVFDGVKPWVGNVPKGYFVDCAGSLTDARFTAGLADPRFVTMIDSPTEAICDGRRRTRMPAIADGEVWFEVVNWVMAAREAKSRFVMMSLGASYGAQAVGSYRMLQQLNPMPAKLVTVEPVPENCEWTARYFRDNGIDPADHWLVPLAVGGDLEPILFPVGAPGSGTQNAIATNNQAARHFYVDVFTQAGVEPAIGVLRNLLLHNTTGVTRYLAKGHNFRAEIKMVSAITLCELLAPFDKVDYLESDIQQSEIVAFPPYMDLLRKKVHRIHIGTHGKDVHWTLHDIFAENGWKIIFSFEPNARHDTALGSFETNDGVLTVVNPAL